MQILHLTYEKPKGVYELWMLIVNSVLSLPNPSSP